MIPNLFNVLKNVTAVTNIFGTNPLKIYRWGEAPQKTVYPYAVYIGTGAAPQNTQDKPPQVDSVSVQIDVFAEKASDVEAGAVAIRDALEVNNHMISFSSPLRDNETKAFRIRMDFDIFNFR